MILSMKENALIKTLEKLSIKFNRWVVEKEFIKHQKSDDAIIDEVKKILKNVILASRMLKQAKNELTFDIERLVNDGYLVQMKKVHWLLLLVKNHFPEVME